MFNIKEIIRFVYFYAKLSVSISLLLLLLFDLHINEANANRKSSRRFYEFLFNFTETRFLEFL